MAIDNSSKPGARPIRPRHIDEPPVFGDSEAITEWCNRTTDQIGRVWYLCRYSMCGVGFVEGGFDPVAAVKIHYRVTHLPMIYAR